MNIFNIVIMKEKTKEIIGIILLCILTALAVELVQSQEYIEPYTVYLDKETKLPIKVAYTLKKPLVKIDRKGYFRQSEGSLDPAQYKGSGYDKGHLFPALYAQTEIYMKNSFNMKNIAPQAPGLNRGEWKQLESYIYDLAYHYDSVQVECGYIGIKSYYNSLPIPRYYWKSIVIWHNGEGITEEYIFPNETPELQGFEKYRFYLK